MVKACIRLSIIPKLITAGKRILQARIPGCNVILADTYLYMPLSLADLGKAMELPEQKGFFPYDVLTPEFESKVFEFPPKTTFALSKMTKIKRQEFDIWYEMEKIKCDGLFDFDAQLLHYCNVSYFFKIKNYRYTIFDSAGC